MPLRIVENAWLICLAALVVAGGGCDDPATSQAPLSRSEMHDAVAEALRIPDTVEHYARIADLAGRLTNENVGGAIEVFDSEIAWVREHDLLPFIHAWTRLDGQAAFQHVLGWAEASKRAFGIAEVTYYWALNGDIALARTYAESIRKPRLAEAAMSGLARGWAETGKLDSLAEYLGHLAPGSGRDHMVRIANGIILLKSGMGALREWIDGIPAEGMNGLRSRTFRTALSQVAFKDPHFAADWLNDFRDEPFASNMVVPIATAWLERDPAQAMTWLNSLPPHRDVDLAAKRAIRRWLRLDPDRVGPWIGNAEDSSVREAAIEVLALHLSSDEPGEAIRWVSEIKSTDRRNQILAKVIVNWDRSDPEAASAWLESADLGDDLRSALSSSIYHPRRPVRREGSE